MTISKRPGMIGYDTRTLQEVGNVTFICRDNRDDTSNCKETEADYIRFMDIVRGELRSLRQMIEYIEANMNAQTGGETSIEEPKREAALPSDL